MRGKQETPTPPLLPYSNSTLQSTNPTPDSHALLSGSLISPAYNTKPTLPLDNWHLSQSPKNTGPKSLTGFFSDNNILGV